MSQALKSLYTGIQEVRALRQWYPVRNGHLATGPRAVAARAHGRACVVLLSSHFEQYIYGINEEAVTWLNMGPYPLDVLPTTTRLLHSRYSIDELAQTSWNKRESKLRAFAAEEVELWRPGAATGGLDHSRLLEWMKSPKPAAVIRFYRQFQIDDIFTTITRSTHSRSGLFFSISTLVEKRNNIAHGDAATEALPSDITSYLRAVKKFAESADRALANSLKKACSSESHPW